VRQVAGEDCEVVWQHQQLGTGHAVMQAASRLQGFIGDLLVLVGDSPFLTPEILRQLVHRRRATGAAAVFLTAIFDRPPPYGRVIRNEKGGICRIVEERDATPTEEAIKEVITAHYCFQAEVVLPLLPEIRNDNRLGEYYLTDIVEILVGHGYRVESLRVDDPRMVLGINTPAEFTAAERMLAARLQNRQRE